MQAQHDAYTALLKKEGVEVVYLDEIGTGRTKSCYANSCIAIGGGAIVTRLGPRIRRGEERAVMRTLATRMPPSFARFRGAEWPKAEVSHG